MLTDRLSVAYTSKGHGDKVLDGNGEHLTGHGQRPPQLKSGKDPGCIVFVTQCFRKVGLESHDIEYSAATISKQSVEDAA